MQITILTFLHSSIAFKIIFLITFPVEIEGYTKKIEELEAQKKNKRADEMDDKCTGIGKASKADGPMAPKFKH